MQLGHGTGAFVKALYSVKKQSLCGLTGTRMPRNNGRWSADAGESNWYSSNSDVNAVTGNKPILFVDGKADFSAWSKGLLHLMMVF